MRESFPNIIALGGGAERTPLLCTQCKDICLAEVASEKVADLENGPDEGYGKE